MMQKAIDVARIEEMKSAYKILVGNFKGTDRTEDLGKGGMIIK
jgi:hypothetical protein